MKKGPFCFFCLIILVSCQSQNTEKNEFAAKLHHSRISSDEDYEKLLVDLNEGMIENGLHFLDYCDKAIILKEDNYPDEPEIYLEQIHRDVSRLLPELEFSDFRFKVEVDTSISDSVDHFLYFVVSLKCNSKTYEQRSFYGLFYPDMVAPVGFKIDERGFYKIFNKVLADHQSAYRLHLVLPGPWDTGAEEQFGIIALTETQSQMLHGSGALFRPTYEDFKNSLSDDRIEFAIKEFSTCGLLLHLSPQEIKMATENVSAGENFNFNDVLQCFPHTICLFEAELTNLEDPYRALLTELSQISHGAFNPARISDRFAHPVNGLAEVSFSIEGNTYSKHLTTIDDWIDPAFFELINEAVTENNVGGQFYELYSDDDESKFIFLTPEQYQYLSANHILIFADQMRETEQ